ncbi:MAG: c-type cytochrome [bacterium]
MQSSLHRRASALLLVLLLLGGATASAGEPPHPGREAYLRYCSACHGEEADGDGPVANVLSPRPPALTKLHEKFGRPLATDLAAYLSGTTGPRAHGPSDMPVWGRVLRETQPGQREADDVLWRIVRYLDWIQEDVE